MPSWDRSIDLVMLTHPKLNHVTGLIAVLERYRGKRWCAGYLAHPCEFLPGEWSILPKPGVMLVDPKTYG